MKIKSIEEQAYEMMKHRFELFAQEIEELCKDSEINSNWLDNHHVCKILKISNRTLQDYRDRGKLPFSMIGNKCFYKKADIINFIEKSQSR